MSRRRRMIGEIWYSHRNQSDPFYSPPEDNKRWANCDKTNLNCDDCCMCHTEKDSKARSKRRRALRHDIVLNLRSWE